MEATKEIKIGNKKEFKDIIFDIKWLTVLQTIAIYVFGVIGLCQLLIGQWKLLTILWTLLIFFVCGFSMSIGSHRMFGHRSFKTNRALKLFLIFGHTLSGQWSIINWVRSHRAHHKYTDTAKDPTNIKNGFWFSHVYWMFWYSPAVKEAVMSIDVSDLKADKDLMFQHNYYLPIHLLSVAIFPVMIPYLLWNEALWIAVFANFARLLINLTQLSVFNSVVHMNGAKTYDEKASAVENVLAIIFTFGEGFHNYHHTFPSDYKCGEFGDLKHFNLSACIIDWWAKHGWVTDRNEATASMVAQMKIKSGDGTHWFESENILSNPQWGHKDEQQIEDLFKNFDL
ncbi:stearoyl-CoA desaturase 5-like [Chironomus tepperi]|uniref:stearoyl-CoA desaturase 5-like n=1 Tax=Chironomus tepperi TaxID=113505 RepID=UPI00391F30F7